MRAWRRSNKVLVASRLWRGGLAREWGVLETIDLRRTSFAAVLKEDFDGGGRGCLVLLQF